MDFSQYLLRSELQGHQEDVRGLCSTQLGLWTASRDKTIKLWTEIDVQNFVPSLTLVGHTSFVSALAYDPDTTGRPKGTLISGSRDLTVRAWDTESATETSKLEGHKYQVTAVAVGHSKSIVSSSLDSTVRIWKDGRCEQVLEHGAPVQCVLVLPNGDLLSGCSDGGIRLWQTGKLAHTFTGHTDTVRGLALLPAVGVLSASHDQTLRLWDYSGTCMTEFVGHTAIIYAVAGSEQGLVASASEDNTARLWRPDGSCLQTVSHPACVWDVEFLPNGDLATACADYNARIFSGAADRQAPAEVQQTFIERTAASQRPESGADQQTGALPAGMKIEDASVLAQPGSRSGEIKVVREDNSGIAYSWDATAGTWEKIGDVVGGPGGDDSTVSVSGKQHNGQQYDFVFDVDVEDGAPPKKLPYNRGGNPYDAADRFMEAENLPWTYREQIVDFIIKNSGGGAALPPMPSVNVDPFTGGGAYIPSNTPVARPPTSSTSAPVTGGGYDPFTGGGAYRPSSTTAAPAQRPAPTSTPSAATIPQTALTIFSAPLKPSAVADKVRTFSSQLTAQADTSSLALSEVEAAPAGTLDSLLTSAPASNEAFPQAELALLSKLLQWPAANLFPALDIARLAVLHASADTYLAASAGPLELSPLGSLGAAIAAAAEEPQAAANQQTGLRLLSNACQAPQLSGWLVSHAQALVGAWAPALAGGPSQPKAVRSAALAFLGNVAVLTRSPHPPMDNDSMEHDHSATSHLGEDFQAQLLSALAEMLQSTPAGDADAVTRALVAVGTVVLGNTSACALARELDLVQVAEAFKSNSSASQAVRQTASALVQVLSSVA